MENQKTANLPGEQFPDTPRAWVTPTFKSAPMQEAMSGNSGEGEDNTYYS